MVNNSGQHSRRLDVVARRLTDPEERLSIATVNKAIEELEANPARTHVAGMPIERLMILVAAEIAALEALLGPTDTPGGLTRSPGSSHRSGLRLKF